MKHYFSYRHQAFSLAISELFKQLQQFVLMLMTMFYIFLPGLIAGLFFGLGKIVQSSSEVVSMQVGLAYLIFQSLLLTVLKPAILDLKHRTFHITLLKNKLPQILSDITALMMCHLLFGLSVFLMISMGADKLSRAPHYIAFAFTQLSFALVLMYRPAAVIWASMLAFSGLFVFESTLAFFLVLNALLLISLYLPKRLNCSYHITITPWTFWLSYFKDNIWSLTWRFTMSGLVFWAVFIIVTERSDLVHWYALGGALINQLWWSSLFIETNQHVREHQLFWKSLNQFTQIKRTQYMYLIALSSMFTLPMLSLFSSHLSMWMSLLITPFVLIFCKNRPQFMAVVWASLAISFIMLMVIF